MLVSAAIIVRDEAEHLGGCLASLQGLVDEIVVVDTGSSDNSVEIARRHGAVVSHEPWGGDFSTSRNRSLDLASGDWILYVDADERVRPGDHAAVRALLAGDAEHVAFRVRFVPRVGWTPYREYRLWRHRPDIRFVNAIHETMLGAIQRVAATDNLLFGELDALTIEHLGYEGEQNHKHARDEPLLRAGLAADPDRPYLYDHLARIYEDTGDNDRARAAWREGISIARARGADHRDDRLLWINLLTHLVAHEDPDGDLVAILDEAQAKFPGNPAVEFAAAAREITTGDPGAAVGRLERLLALDVDALVATDCAYDERMLGEWTWNALGLARLELGDAAGAADAFRRAEAADATNDAYRVRRRLAEARASAR
jgi:glycosyltransferase involved in cell wall biosynthesis